MRYNLLEQFDDTSEYGILKPEYVIAKPTESFPETVVAEFSEAMIQSVAKKYSARQICEIISVAGNIPIYKMNYKGKDVAFFRTMIGAPACCSCFEEVIAMGAKKFMLCGECGVLRQDIVDGRIIVPTAAMREEGTSYHYCASADEIELDPDGVATVEKTLCENEVPYIKGKIWTTDASYRETVTKMKARRDAGCIAVEMECAAMVAVARMRRVKFAQFVYASDNLDSPVWEQRGLTVRPIQQKEDFFDLALDCAIRL